MTDINEQETIDYFVSGIKKAQSAAKELALLNSKGIWYSIAKTLDQILVNAKKLYTGKPQTRMNNLIIANDIMEDQVQDASSKKIIH